MDEEAAQIIKEAEQIPVYEVRGERGLRVPIPPAVAEAAVVITLSLLFVGGAWTTWH